MNKLLKIQKIIRFIPFINILTIFPLPFVVGKNLSGIRDIVKICIGGILILGALWTLENILNGIFTDNNVIKIINNVSGILACYCMSFYSVYIQEKYSKT